MRFRIFGNGAFGSALSVVFRRNMLLEDSLGDVFEPFLPGDIAVPAVPSDVLFLVLKKIEHLGRPEAIMLVSKGISTSKLVTQDLTDRKIDIPMLYFLGPNLAGEIMENTEFLSATLAGPAHLTQPIADFLEDMIIDQTEDLILAQIAGFMKNITAFVIGFLAPNQNGRATLIAQGMKEAAILAKKLGSTSYSEPNNFARACFSDFVLTCTSPNSRNFQAGLNLKNGLVKNETQESLKSVDHIFGLKGDLNLPITQFFHDLVKFGNSDRALLQKQIREFR